MPLSEESDPFARRHFAGSAAAKLCRPGTVPAGTVGAGTVQAQPVPAAYPRSAPPPPPGSPHRPAPPRRQRSKARAAAHTPRRLPWLFLLPHLPALLLPRHCPAAHGGGLSDLPVLGGDGLPDEQRTARPITCPGCSFQPHTAAALMTSPLCCLHPCQTYRQRQPPARQHPAASPTPEGSDSPPNGIWL